MRETPSALWGSAEGPLRDLAPASRLVCGAAVFSLVFIVPVRSAVGAVTAPTISVLWFLVTRPPLRLVRSTGLLGMVLFLPYYLLTPVIVAESGEITWLAAAAAPFEVSCRGIAAMMISVFTVTTLTASDFRHGVNGLPLPEIVKAVIVQIVHQTETLVLETRRMAAAVSVRGGTDGYRTAVSMVAALPKMWIPRVIDRAERVAVAMEMRGFCQRDIAPVGGVAVTLKDRLAVVISLLGLGIVIAWRWWDILK